MSGSERRLSRDELRDFILFMTHSFLRPTESEIYALTHRDIAIADNPKRLIITIRKGKTGHRISNTMPAAVSVYERIKRRHEGYGLDDYLFHRPTRTVHMPSGSFSGSSMHCWSVATSNRIAIPTSFTQSIRYGTLRFVCG